MEVYCKKLAGSCSVTGNGKDFFHIGETFEFKSCQDIENALKRYCKERDI